MNVELDLPKQRKAKAIEIYMLASTYNALGMNEINIQDVEHISFEIDKRWKKINDKIIANGWESVSLNSVVSLEKSCEIAYLFSNTKKATIDAWIDDKPISLRLLTLLNKLHKNYDFYNTDNQKDII